MTASLGKYEAFHSLPQKWKDTILRLQSVCPERADPSLVPEFLTKSQEIIFFYFLFKDYRSVKIRCKVGSDRIKKAVDYFILNKAFPADSAKGRKRKINSEIIELVKAHTQTNPHMSHKQVQDFLKTQNISLSIGSIHRLRFDIQKET